MLMRLNGDIFCKMMGIVGQLLLVLYLAVPQTGAAESWNQAGSTVNPNIVPTQGGTLEPERIPSTITPSNASPGSVSTEIASNTTSMTFNITTIPPDTNIEDDGLITGTKSPSSSMKPASKALTFDPTDTPTSFQPNDVINNLEDTTDVSSTVIDAESTVVPSSSTTRESPERTLSGTTRTHSSNLTSQGSTSVLYSDQPSETTILVTSPVVATNSIITPIQITHQQSITPRQSTLTQRITTSRQDITTQSTLRHSTSLIPTTTIFTSQPMQAASTASTVTMTSRVFTPVRTATTQRSQAFSTHTTSPAHIGTQSSVQNQTDPAVVITRPHQHTQQHGQSKATKQPGGRQGQSASPVTSRSGAPIEGDQNDDKESHPDSDQSKDPHDENINIPGNIPTSSGNTTLADQWVIEHNLYPPVYLQLILMMKVSEFCHQLDNIQSSLDQVVRDIVISPSIVQTGFIGTEKICEHAEDFTTDPVNDESVTLEFYVTVGKQYDTETNLKVGRTLQEDPSLLEKYLSVKVLGVNIRRYPDMITPPSHDKVKGRPTNLLGIEISVPLGLVCLIVLAIAGFLLYKAYKLKIARQTYKDRYYFDGSKLHDSMNDQDSQKLSPLETKAAVRRTLLIPVINPAFEHDDPEDEDIIALQVFPSHILSITALAKFYTYMEALVQEFQTLPDFQYVIRGARKAPPSPLSPRRLAATLPGHSIFDKLHHHKILTPTKTQVMLLDNMFPVGEEPNDLHANFVLGYNETRYAYIASQAPQTRADEFWQMIWEQQTKTILLLCAPEEMGTRCVWYWPKEQGIQAAQLYGNILVMLQGQVETDNYIMSNLLIKDIQKNLCRPVTHCWFCQWPEMEIPINPRALIVYLLQVRQTFQENPGPVVVHCSDGFGRAGTAIAIDICMQSMEDSHSVDIPSTVSNIRQDRGSAVHNREQYSFIYKVMYEYSTMLIASSDSETNFIPHPNTTTQSMPLKVMSQ